jgi:hypothetical protein
MIRTLKALGLALFAAFALSAVAASTASAVEKHVIKVAKNPTYFTAEQKTDGTTLNEHGVKLEGTQEFKFTTGDKNTLKCKKVKAEGKIAALEVASVTATNVEYSECSNWETNEKKETVTTVPLTVNFNGCDYHFYGETTATPEGTAGEHAIVEIKCPEGKHIETLATGLKTQCIDIFPQSVHGAKYFNGETGGVKDVAIHATMHGIKSTTTGACGTGEHTTGTYTGEITVKGYSDEAHTTASNISVSPGERTATHLFTSDGLPTHLTAEAKTDGETTDIHGEKLKGTQELQAKTNDAVTLKCKKVSAKGTSEGLEAESVTATNVEYSECSAWETNEAKETKTTVPVTVKFNECDYKFYGNTTETKEGTAGEHAIVEIKCPEGKHIEILATGLKTQCIDLFPQSTHGVKYFNGETGGVKDVIIHATAHGIKSTTTGACGTGEHTTGTYTGEITVKGYSDEAHTIPSNISVSPGATT